MASAARPSSAYALVSQLRTAVAALRADLDDAHAELHVLGVPAAQRLGLYPVRADRAANLSPEAWADAFDVLQASVRALRSSLRPADSARVTELGAQATEFVHAAAGVDAAARLADRPGTAHALPEALYLGALRSDAPPAHSREASHEILEALCAAISPVAAQLRLESFVDRVEAPADGDVPMSDATERTHTFTSGGRIIVLDIELALDTRHWAPKVRLQISYAHAAEDTQAGAPSDTRLATLMGTILQELADLLYGAQEARAAPPAPTPYARALSLWQAFVQHLATLAYIDKLSAHAVRRVEGSPAVDLFALLEALGECAEDVCRTQAQSIHGTPPAPLATLEQTHPDVAQRLTRCAQGIALQHTLSPYLTIVYALPAPHAPSGGARHTATVRIAPCAVPLGAAERARRLPLPDAAARTLHADGTIVSGAPLWTPSGTEPPVQRPLALVALLDPPVRVPHRVAHAVWAACQLAEPPWSDTPSHAAGAPHDYAAALLPPGTYRAAPGSRASEVRTISALPCTSLAQLYEALALLRDHARIAELLRLAPTDSRVPAALAVDAYGASSCVRLSFAAPSRGAMAGVAVALDAAHASGYAMDAHVVQLSSGTRHTLSSHETAAWADRLADTARLGEVVDAAHDWVERVLEPPPS